MELHANNLTLNENYLDYLEKTPPQEAGGDKEKLMDSLDTG
jgi:hypothetical protein